MNEREEGSTTIYPGCTKAWVESRDKASKNSEIVSSILKMIKENSNYYTIGELVKKEYNKLQE